MFQRAWKVFRKFCPLCYKQVIALSPHRIKDNFTCIFKVFTIALVAARLGQFCENFENTRENLSLILLGLMRLHIQIILCYLNNLFSLNWVNQTQMIFISGALLK